MGGIVRVVMTVGTQTTLYMDWDGDSPEEGDILRSHPGGSCYMIDELRELVPRSSPKRFRARCTRLGKDAALVGEDGVRLFVWHRQR